MTESPERGKSRIAMLVTASLLLGASALGLASACHWREGREVWISRREAGPGDAGANCGTPEDPCWIDAFNLLNALNSGDNDIELLDLRPLVDCRANRIPGAECNPFDGMAFSEQVDCSGEGWLVLYDWNGSTSVGAAWELDLGCERLIMLLEEGFSSWSVVCGDDCIIQGAGEASPDAG
jgi:hypothetical protein